MKVQIGSGITLGENGYLVSPPIAGLDEPERRTARDNFAGRDGAYVSNQLYGGRTVTIIGGIVGRDCDDYESKRKILGASLPIRVLTDFTITTPSGDRFLLEGYVIDFQSDWDGIRIGEFKIDIFSPSAHIYSANGFIEHPFQKVVGGGYATPYSLPVEWQAGTQPTNIFNGGDSVIYPQFILNGKFTDPMILNMTTNRFVKLENFSSNLGDEIIFDMRKRTITLNGGNVINKRTIDSSWFGLELGANVIELTSDSALDSMDGVVKYREQFTSI